ncbi:MAG: hypothetical protein PVI97_00210 [Candidatus Thiodiazotropha sp.]|jgi:hypothetical protein
MGMFTGLVAAGKALLGMSRTDGADKVMEVARGVGSWIDEQQFTEEEKAIQLAELGKSVTAFVAATKDENTERSITRRSIAIWIMRAEILTLAASAVVFPIPNFQGWAEYLFKMASFSAPLGWMASGVVVFFFGTHMLRGYVNGKAKGPTGHAH